MVWIVGVPLTRYVEPIETGTSRLNTSVQPAISDEYSRLIGLARREDGAKELGHFHYWISLIERTDDKRVIRGSLKSFCQDLLLKLERLLAAEDFDLHAVMNGH